MPSHIQYTKVSQGQESYDRHSHLRGENDSHQYKALRILMMCCQDPLFETLYFLVRDQFLFFKAGSMCVAQANLEIMILLPQPSQELRLQP